MNFSELLKVIESVKIGNSKTIYKLDDVELYIHRPEKLGASLKRKDYDPKKNFQIFMKTPGKKDFKPNHLRVLLDLHLKHESDPKLSERIFEVMEAVYKGEDPLKFSKEISKMKFRMQLDSAIVNVCSAQLFMAEQEINYTKGKVQPPRAYLMGYIRMIRTGNFEIDKILWSSTRHPPRKEFRTKETTLKDILF